MFCEPVVQKSRRGGRRPGAGRPATGRDAVSGVRLPETMTSVIDAYAEQWGIKRSEAIRRLLKLALDATQSSDCQKVS
jgi:hypothetical protein